MRRFRRTGKTRAAHTRSTVGQVAEAAKESHYKAAQAVYIAKTAPALVEKVIKGEMKLKDAFTRAKAAAPARKPARTLMLKKPKPLEGDAQVGSARLLS